MEVEINGIKAELGNSLPSITKKSIDIGNPSARFVDFTNSFQLPDTAINRQIFNSPRGVGTNNRSFEKLYDVIIRDVFVIFYGYGVLSNSKKDTFSFQVLDKSKELFNALKTKINTISWDDKDTILTEAAINSLDAIDEDSPWIWGKACYHKNALQINTDQTTGVARCKYSRPAFYLQGLLKRALSNCGYTFNIPEPYLALSSNHKEFYFTSYQKTIDATFNPSGTLAVTGLDTNDFEHADLTVVSTTINISAFRTKFRFRGVLTSSANIDLIVKATDNADGTKIEESKYSINSNDTTIDFESSEFQSDTGYTIDIYFSGTGTVVMSDVLLYTLLPEEYEDLSTNPWLNYWIKVHDNLPNLEYLDIFKLINVISNKYQVVDSLNKELSFNSLANINKINSFDWSDKFIIDSESVDNSFGKLAKKNYLKYSNDLTVNSRLGEDYFETDGDYLEDEADYLKLDYGASNDVTINSNTIGQINIYDNTTRIQDQEIAPRLFNIDGGNLEFNSISWKNIKLNYYLNWFNSMSRVRPISCLFNLTKLDVMRWNESDLIYVKHFKSTFIVLEINNFIANRPTRVKLLNYGR